MVSAGCGGDCTWAKVSAVSNNSKATKECMLALQARTGKYNRVGTLDTGRVEVTRHFPESSKKFMRMLLLTLCQSRHDPANSANEGPYLSSVALSIRERSAWGLPGYGLS